MFIERTFSRESTFINRTFPRESRRQARSAHAADAIVARVLAATTAAAVAAYVRRRKKRLFLRRHDKNDSLFCGFVAAANSAFTCGFYAVRLIVTALASRPPFPLMRYGIMP